MSNAPGNFSDNPNSFQQDPYAAPRKKGSLMWLWILLGILGGGGVLACACCGGGGLLSMSVFGNVLAQSLNGNPVVEEHIGTIESASFNVMKTGEAGQGIVGDEKPIVVDVKGTKGSGTVEGYVKKGTTNFESGTLTTADGQTFDLFPPEADEKPEMPTP